MEQVFSRRGYVRTDNFAVDAKTSENGKDWHDVSVPNIAAGGLLFETDYEHKEGDELWFNLLIDPRIAIVIPVSVKAKGAIKSDRGIHSGKHMYAVEFVPGGISSDDQIRLDELVRLAVAKYGEM
jgi:hypothetical protein